MRECNIILCKHTVLVILVSYAHPHTCTHACMQGESGFMEAALRELPTRTEADIQAHSNWHTEHCTLLEAKKLSIQQWRESKQVL